MVRGVSRRGGFVREQRTETHGLEHVERTPRRGARDWSTERTHPRIKGEATPDGKPDAPERVPVPVIFIGGSLKDLQNFPPAVQKKLGYALYEVQCGADPADPKMIKALGGKLAGFRELKVRLANHGGFRVIYRHVETKDPEVDGEIAIPHCFQKKTDETPKKDVDLILERWGQFEKQRERRR